MVLFVTVNKGNRDMQDFDCHIHDKGLTIPRTVASDVIELQADGHELEYIRERFQNIPMHKGRVVRWKGEMAKFIAINLT